MKASFQPWTTPAQAPTPTYYHTNTIDHHRRRRRLHHVQRRVGVQHVQLRRRPILGRPLHSGGRFLRLVPAILRPPSLRPQVPSHLLPRPHGRLRQCR